MRTNDRRKKKSRTKEIQLRFLYVHIVLYSMCSTSACVVTKLRVGFLGSILTLLKLAQNVVQFVVWVWDETERESKDSRWVGKKKNCMPNEKWNTIWLFYSAMTNMCSLFFLVFLVCVWRYEREMQEEVVDWWKVISIAALLSTHKVHLRALHRS